MACSISRSHPCHKLLAGPQRSAQAIFDDIPMGTMNTYLVLRSLYECIDPENDIIKFGLACPMSPSRMLLNLASCLTTLSMLTFKIARTLPTATRACRHGRPPLLPSTPTYTHGARWADVDMIKFEFEKQKRLEAEKLQVYAVYAHAASMHFSAPDPNGFS